ncbi:MAG: peptidase MA family metallohydrolase [Sphaerobacter sp.]|nr:peptidase MA family metallohydrolase [Sphaerobacter sp.]
MASSVRGRVSLALLLALLALAAPVLPQSTGAAPLTVHANRAEPDFPNGITFHLHADAPQPVVRLELRYYPAHSLVTRVARPPAPGDRRVEVSHTVELRLTYLPPGVDVHYRWRLTLADGSIVETPEQTVFYMDERHPWQTLQSGLVTVYYYAGNPSFAQEALDTTLRAIRRFDQAFGVTTDQPLRVVIYANERDFAAALPAGSDDWVGGFAEPELGLIVVAIRPGDRGEIARMLSHEVIHVVLDQATANPFNAPPPWLNEGIASYYQDVRDERFPAVLQRAVRSGQLDTVRALNSPFPADPAAAILAYAESESIVRFIIETKGERAMADLLAVFREGVAYEAAVQRALGLTLDQLDQEWKAWLSAGQSA